MGRKRKTIELGQCNVGEMAEKRLEELDGIVKQLKEIVKKPTDGMLRVQKKGKGFQFYIRTEADDTEGKYIKKKDLDVARKIAEKEYYSKLLEELTSQIDILSKVSELCDSERVRKIYRQLHPGKRMLVEPVLLETQEYVDRWIAMEYDKMGFQILDETDYYTSKGERVRSKSEIVIADTLARMGVPYRYEYPLELNGMGTVHPDFYCLNKRLQKEIVWEHFGMMTDYEYSLRAVKKIERYMLNGYFPGENFIYTMEAEGCTINTKLLENIIKQYLL